MSVFVTHMGHAAQTSTLRGRSCVGLSMSGAPDLRTLPDPGVAAPIYA